jgi:hypothetical protein
MTDLQISVISILCATVIATTISAIIFMPFLVPSEEQIKNCMKVTNYSYERCEWEMTK